MPKEKYLSERFTFSIVYRHMELEKPLTGFFTISGLAKTMKAFRESRKQADDVLPDTLPKHEHLSRQEQFQHATQYTAYPQEEQAAEHGQMPQSQKGGSQNMTNEELNTSLYKKMFAEQEQFREWLLTQPPEEILKHTYEYTLREDILLSMEYHNLSDEQAVALLKSAAPLGDVFKDFEKIETDYMDTVWDCIQNRADDMLKAQKDLRKTPIYMQTPSYAREHGEQALFRTSHNVNIACRDAMEKAISEHYDYATSHFDSAGVFAEIKDQFGEERMKYVLAATVQVHDWDGRYSAENKAWASTIPVVDGTTAWGNRNTEFSLNQAHPVLIDALITRTRKELEKKPSVLEKLKDAQEPLKPSSPKRLKEAER